MNKNILKIVSALVALATVGSVAVFAAQDSGTPPATPETVWEGISGSYYQIPEASTLAKSRMARNGITKIAERFSVGYTFLDADEMETFLSEYERLGNIKDMLQPMNEYVGLMGGADGGTTILLEDGDVLQTYLNDNGDMYMLRMDDATKRMLADSGLKLENTTAQDVGFPGFAGGILFSDGEQEFYYPLELRYYEDLNLRQLYPMADIMDSILRNKADLTTPMFGPDFMP